MSQSGVPLDRVAPAKMTAYRETLTRPAVNAQPVEVYLYFARLERRRENTDSLPTPDAPWTALGKRLTGRADEIVPVPTIRVPSLRRKTCPSDTLRNADNEWSPLSGATELNRIGDNNRTHTGHLTMSTTELAKSDAPAMRSEDSEKNAENGQPGGILINAQERQSTYRLLRVAGWEVVFYLITTDMLGWFTAEKAYSMLGFGPGTMVYTFFFLLAFASGQALWWIYMQTDSEEYPVRSYADIGERTYGPGAKYLFNVLQGVQLTFNVGMFIVMQGQALAAIINYKFCYIALNVFFAVGGMILTQVRTMRNVAWFTNINLFLNMIILFLTAYGIAMYDAIPSQSGHKDLSEPITTYAWVPPGTSWQTQVAGTQLAVFAYGGAMIFVEFLAEMRRPRDFWKAALMAQSLCWLTYMFFGMFGYGIQGQYSSILPTVNIASDVFQGLTNIIGLFCIYAIAILYAHMGCKLVYRLILRGVFRAPSLTDASSALYWALLVVVYWLVAWAIGSAIPNITDLNIVVGAACAMQFTYTFPPLLLLGHWMQVDATTTEAPWRPGIEPGGTRIDSWRDWSRWRRAITSYWYAKLALALITLASLVLAGLGMYSGVLSAQHSYKSGITTAFSCKTPGQPMRKRMLV